MTDELISKIDVVKIVKSVLSPASSLVNVARARRQMLNEINELESKSKPHWIPVTEEPIPDGEYLVTWTSEIQEKPILSIVCRYSEVWDCWELQLLGHKDIKILAYMPLPEPYKGVTE